MRTRNLIYHFFNLFEYDYEQFYICRRIQSLREHASTTTFSLFLLYHSNFLLLLNPLVLHSPNLITPVSGSSSSSDISLIPASYKYSFHYSLKTVRNMRAQGLEAEQLDYRANTIFLFIIFYLVYSWISLYDFIIRRFGFDGLASTE